MTEGGYGGMMARVRGKRVRMARTKWSSFHQDWREGWGSSQGQCCPRTVEEAVEEAERIRADVVIGAGVDCELVQLGQGGSMLMVSASGTAIKH